jgi:hypothetical protein
MSSADLTELLRASRPVAPDSLRERVRSIAQTETTGARFARFHLPRLRFAVPAAVTVAVAAAALVAVIRPEHEPAKRDAVYGAGAQLAAPKTATTEAATDRALRATAPQASTTGAPPTPTTGRAQDYQAQIELEVTNGDALSDATKQAMAIVQRLGGHVDSVQYASSDTGSASLVLRVPTARVEDAVTRLTALGRITSQHVQIQDLQETLDQLDARVTTLRSRIAHVTALLQDTSLTAERRAQLEAQRAQLQTTLRRMRRDRAGTAERAAFATVQLSLTTKERSSVTPPASRLDRTLDEAARILTWEGVVALYALVVVGPFALLGALAWMTTRTRRRGAERRLLARP